MTDRLQFKAEDFCAMPGWAGGEAATSARIAQAKFDAWLAAQPEVYQTVSDTTPNFNEWWPTHTEGDTHRARLCCIEKLEAE